MNWKRDLGWVVAVTVATTLSAALGLSQGLTWAGGSADIAYWGERGTGSLGWMDQLAASVVIWLGGLAITLVAGVVVGASTSRHRRSGLLLLVVLSTIAIAAGFLVSAGYGGELGYPATEAPGGLLAVLSATLLGSLVGYAIGTRAGSRGPRPPARVIPPPHR